MSVNPEETGHESGEAAPSWAKAMMDEIAGFKERDRARDLEMERLKGRLEQRDVDSYDETRWPTTEREWLAYESGLTATAKVADQLEEDDPMREQVGQTIAMSRDMRSRWNKREADRKAAQDTSMRQFEDAARESNLSSDDPAYRIARTAVEHGEPVDIVSEHVVKARRALLEARGESAAGQASSEAQQGAQGIEDGVTREGVPGGGRTDLSAEEQLNADILHKTGGAPSSQDVLDPKEYTPEKIFGP